MIPHDAEPSRVSLPLASIQGLFSVRFQSSRSVAEMLPMWVHVYMRLTCLQNNK